MARSALVVGLAAVMPLAAGVTASSASPRGSSPATPGVVWRLAWRAGFSHGSGLISVTAAGPDQIWAFGEAGNGAVPYFILHWNGHRWHLPGLPGGNFIPEAIQASPTGDVWIAGWSENGPVVPVAYSWTGQQWHRIPLPASSFPSLLVLGPSDAWIAGASTRVSKHLGTLLWHWNGSAWKRYQVPVVLNFTDSIAGNSDKNLWVAGVQSPRLYSTGWLIAYKWTGQAWKQAPIQRRWIIGAPGISASWTGDVWIEAYSPKYISSGLHRTIVLHHQGKRWNQLPERVLIDGGFAAFPPTAVGHGIWFGINDYWNGRTRQIVSFSSHGQCYGVYPAQPPGIAEIPRTTSALLAASCPHYNNGRMQGVLFISKYTAHIP